MEPVRGILVRALGEIMFRGNLTMKGYLKNPHATEKEFAGGWFHSGDLAVVHGGLSGTGRRLHGYLPDPILSAEIFVHSGRRRPTKLQNLFPRSGVGSQARLGHPGQRRVQWGACRSAPQSRLFHFALDVLDSVQVLLHRRLRILMSG